MKKFTHTVDDYLIDGCMRCKYGGTPACKVNNWRQELTILRDIVNDSELIEEIKWGVPCYSINGKNVLTLTAFKEFACISFFKGVLIEDIGNLLIKPGERSQSARYLKFTNIEQITSSVELIKNYINQAIEIEKSGKTVVFSEGDEPIPMELEQKFDENPQLRQAFESLTKGKQRAYLIYFSQVKSSESKLSRINKCEQKILNGEGLNDKYKRNNSSK